MFHVFGFTCNFVKLILRNMIRKFIFASLALAAAFSSQPLWSQDCTPATLSEPGILPESLPFAQKDQSYSETISVLLFADTMVEANGQKVKAVIDSMVLLGVNGLPDGINYRCKDGINRFLPLTPSCISVYGTPTEEGTFPLEIPVMSYAKVLGFVSINQGDTIRNYVLNVYGGGASLDKIDLKSLNIFPNPASDKISVLSGDIPRLLTFNGTEIALPWEPKGPVFVADVAALPSGIYMIIANGQVARFVKP